MRTFLVALVACTLVALAPSPAGAVTSDYSRTPILLIHGYFVIANAGDATWSNFRKRLVDDGWPDEYIMTPSFNDVRGCNEDHVNEIDAWVEALRDHTGFDKVDIICHSFGCLNTLSWLKERCGMNRVRQFVGMAGAVHGTWIACADQLLNISCAGRQMCIDTGTDGWKSNDLIVQENACDETPGETQYTTVWSDYDEIIRPPSGAEMAGARNIEVETAFVEHGGIFLCDECYDHARTALTEGGLNEDGPSWECWPQCTPPEIADPQPEPVPEEATDTGVPGDVPATDLPQADDTGAGDTTVVEAGIEDAVTTDPGTTPDREPEVASSDVPVTDLPAETPDVPVTPAKRSSGCATGSMGAGSDGSAAGLWLGLSLLAFAGVARRRRA